MKTPPVPWQRSFNELLEEAKIQNARSAVTAFLKTLTGSELEPNTEDDDFQDALKKWVNETEPAIQIARLTSHIDERRKANWPYPNLEPLFVSLTLLLAMSAVRELNNTHPRSEFECPPYNGSELRELELPIALAADIYLQKGCLPVWAGDAWRVKNLIRTDSLDVIDASNNHDSALVSMIQEEICALLRRESVDAELSDLLSALTDEMQKTVGVSPLVLDAGRRVGEDAQRSLGAANVGVIPFATSQQEDTKQYVADITRRLKQFVVNPSPPVPAQPTTNTPSTTTSGVPSVQISITNNGSNAQNNVNTSTGTQNNTQTIQQNHGTDPQALLAAFAEFQNLLAANHPQSALVAEVQALIKDAPQGQALPPEKQSKVQKFMEWLDGVNKNTEAISKTSEGLGKAIAAAKSLYDQCATYWPQIAQALPAIGNSFGA